MSKPDTGKAVAYLAALVVGLVVVGWIALAVLNWLIGSLAYLIVGALVVGGGILVYRRTRRALAPGTRAQRRIEAAAKTYRMRR